MGKKLKPVPEGNKGLKKLPTKVRNKMGFMRRGGKVTSSKNESGNNISDADRKKVKRLFIQESGKSISDADREKINQMMGKESGRGISDADRNKIAKNDSKIKSSPQMELGTIFEIQSSFPLIKKNDYYVNTIEPKLSFRVNPSDMNKYTDESRSCLLYTSDAADE